MPYAHKATVTQTQMHAYTPPIENRIHTAASVKLTQGEEQMSSAPTLWQAVLEDSVGAATFNPPKNPCRQVSY
jgi:hypothetical protein